MPTNDQEQSWAVALKAEQVKHQHEAIQWPTKIFGIQKDLVEAKRMLTKTLSEKNTAAVKEAVVTLIRLRAEQLSCALHQYQEQGGKEPFIIARLIAQYKKDCQDLIASVDVALT